MVLKELMDNALDACEEAEVAPGDLDHRRARIDHRSRTTRGGIEDETIKSILDYTIRVSSREAYVSPTRGAQGNALKTILAMGYVLDRERQGSNAEAVGVTIIETRGIKHQHRVPGRSRQQPTEDHPHHRAIAGQVGTRITINWPDQRLDAPGLRARRSSNGSLRAMSGSIRT